MRRAASSKTFVVSALLPAVIISLLLSIPAFRSGAVVEETAPVNSSDRRDSNPASCDVPQTASEPQGLPVQHAPHFETAFFRPLSRMLVLAELSVAGRDLRLPHLVSLAWWIVLLVGFLKLLIALPIPRPHIKWIMLVYAVVGYHTALVGFIAARHALMAGTFTVWALFFHLLQQKRPYRYLTLSLACFLLGLLSGEAALVFPFAALACDLSTLSGGSVQRRLSAAPAVAIGLLYRVLYAVFGFGGSSSADRIYHVDALFSHVTLVPERALLAMGSVALGMPGELEWTEAAVSIPMAALMLGATLVGSAMLLSRQRLGEITTTVLKGSLGLWFFSMLPELSGLSTGRFFCIAGMGFSIFVVTLLSVVGKQYCGRCHGIGQRNSKIN